MNHLLSYPANVKTAKALGKISYDVRGCERTRARNRAGVTCFHWKSIVAISKPKSLCYSVLDNEVR